MLHLVDFTLLQLPATARRRKSKSAIDAGDLAESPEVQLELPLFLHDQVLLPTSAAGNALDPDLLFADAIAFRKFFERTCPARGDRQPFGLSSIRRFCDSNNLSLTK